MKIEEMNGLILLDKSAGMTSFGADSAIKKILSTKKVGHIGTLDPFATGLLPICIGKGLRFVRFADSYDKAYRCCCVFGRSTDTMDLEGEVVGGRLPSAEELDQMRKDDFAMIRKVFSEIALKTAQIPPKYSAKKINGRKAYELAREGIEIELKEVPIKIHKLEIKDISINDGMIEAVFEVYCSKGTYIRELCNDVGEKTGFGAYAKSLRRIRNGPFDEASAISLDEIRQLSEKGDLSFIRDASLILSGMPELKLSSSQAADIKQGKKIPAGDLSDDLILPRGQFYKAVFENEIIAVVYETEEKGRILLRIERMLA